MPELPLQPKLAVDAEQGSIVLGIDPSTWTVGFSVWKGSDWVDAGELRAEATRASRDGTLGYKTRMHDLSEKLIWLLKRWKPVVVVIEEPSSFGRGHRGQSRLTLAVGFLAGTVKGFGTDVRFARVEEWYPRSPGTRRRAKKEVAIELLKDRFKVPVYSEHALMATGLVDWFLNGRRN